MTFQTANKKKIKSTAIQFIKFGIVGLSNTIISYLIYALLVYLGLHYLIASIIAFFISVLNSFFWNSRYVFKKEDGAERSVLHALIKTFISYAFTGLILQNIFLFVFIDLLHISKYIAPLFILVVTVPLNFIMNKFWAFRQSKINLEIPNEENKHTNTLL